MVKVNSKWTQETLNSDRGVARCVVTGVAGFIGSHVAERLVRDGHQVVGIDSFLDNYSQQAKMANLSNMSGADGFHLIQGDLLRLDLEKLLDGVHYVFHLAAQPGVRDSWGASFDVYLRNNVLATQLLLEAARGHSLERFVYASSSAVYGDADQLPVGETTLPSPVSPYGVSKLAAEHLCHLYWRNYDIPTISLRYFTVYGPRQRPDMAFHKFIRATLEGNPVTIYGDGYQTRDFTYIDDIVTANILACRAETAGMVLNIGGGSNVSIRGAISALEVVTERKVDLRFEPVQAGEARNTAADITQARNVLGYQPTHTLEEGLKDQVAWYRGFQTTLEATSSH